MEDQLVNKAQIALPPPYEEKSSSPTSSSSSQLPAAGSALYRMPPSGPIPTTSPYPVGQFPTKPMQQQPPPPPYSIPYSNGMYQMPLGYANYGYNNHTQQMTEYPANQQPTEPRPSSSSKLCGDGCGMNRKRRIVIFTLVAILIVGGIIIVVLRFVAFNGFSRRFGNFPRGLSG